MKNALAIVIGLNDYQNINKLDNAVNDAELIGESLENLGFVVKRALDKSLDEIDDLLDDFYKELPDYDLGLFYFAGHGFQYDGKNLLACKEINMRTLGAAERGSIMLDNLIANMEKTGVSAKVIILDACRKPIEGLIRGMSSNAFAPVFAPKGTLIAFSTSPGEGAKDGRGEHSHYTLAFVQHLKQENIEIELFFKRVRATLSAVTSGGQTSWEHTSLIGPLILNSGQLRHSKNLPYSDKVVADHEFKTVNSGSEIDLLLAALSGNWDKQNAALDKIETLPVHTWSDDQLFLLGRGLINAGENTANSARPIFENLKGWLVDKAGEKAHHILNGMFYEVYFNGYGLFRKNNLKQSRIKELIDLQEDARFASSFQMINEQLQPFANRLFYIPGPETMSLPVDLNIDAQKDDNGRFIINTVHIHGKNITNERIEEEYPTQLVTQEKFLEMLGIELKVPADRIILNPRIDAGTRINVPYSYLNRRITTDPFKEVDQESESYLSF